MYIAPLTVIEDNLLICLLGMETYACKVNAYVCEAE